MRFMGGLVPAVAWEEPTEPLVLRFARSAFARPVYMSNDFTMRE